MARARVIRTAEALPAVLVLTGACSALPAVARRLRRAGLHVSTTASPARARRLLSASESTIALVICDTRVARQMVGATGSRVGDVTIVEVPGRTQSQAVTFAIKTIVRDTVDSELHTAERYAALDAAADGIIWLDRQARIRIANIAAAKLLGSSDIRDLRKEPIASYLQFRSPEAARGVLSFAGLVLLPRGQQVCWREDGSSFPVEYETGPLFEHGRLTGAVLTFRDISDRRASDLLKDELVGIVSHELRAPLTSMRSALGLLASGRLTELPASAQRMLDIAVSSTDRLIRLVNDLLDFERLEKDQMPMAIERSDMGALMTHAADALRPLAEKAGVLLEVAPIAAHLAGDPDRLLQVLINLLGNAIKFSSAGGTVWLDAERVAGELTLRIRDQGRGIPSDKLESIFNRFAQVEASDARDNKGTGLGLAICRGMVRQHSGQIWAESTNGVGTTFFVALPCEDVSRSEPASGGQPLLPPPVAFDVFADDAGAVAA